MTNTNKVSSGGNASENSARQDHPERVVHSSSSGIDSNPNSNVAVKVKKASFLRLVLTSFAAAAGVQSSKNLVDDFSQKSPFPFIAAGIIFTVVFLGTIILIVKYVLSDI